MVVTSKSIVRSSTFIVAHCPRYDETSVKEKSRRRIELPIVSRVSSLTDKLKRRVFPKRSKLASIVSTVAQRPFRDTPIQIFDIGCGNLMVEIHDNWQATRARATGFRRACPGRGHNWQATGSRHAKPTICLCAGRGDGCPFIGTWTRPNQAVFFFGGAALREKILGSTDERI